MYGLSVAVLYTINPPWLFLYHKINCKLSQSPVSSNYAKIKLTLDSDLKVPQKLKNV